MIPEMFWEHYFWLQERSRKACSVVQWFGMKVPFLSPYVPMLRPRRLRVWDMSTVRKRVIKLLLTLLTFKER